MDDLLEKRHFFLRPVQKAVLFDSNVQGLYSRCQLFQVFNVKIFY